ncbi:hypothetical protein COCC4DRAFT_184298 [Bipolaris maydis ATCC 48331]|uniref:Uncharacterized protein n=2 Tax=Cochliobolus heterostrophus TaxID=5016 RepID=M2V7Y5_COCH5|nr:uncharacterized protein COCC4DRAFT_184298 [Bipolaris maydis ATCC 48331]EMD96112.1 hypothetical protein COCHEDRAFT_1127590 [Bipolaris maydis C5]KAJ5030791.1 hypothetical protein J3E73DRAFT_26595 [Bipolaris maydis]ENI10971.1 hypothetical protein COCC4DRAFT_184298 [Bipolaris maydis ATCC 48331]KAJ5040766.1 hypothetical protein J3E74DRAFT_284404 [Bipolaris maydis]KAJ5065811.1 hypothetical protein J3E74DRAFT_4216 [Bipolaris maydis]
MRTFARLYVPALFAIGVESKAKHVIRDLFSWNAPLPPVEAPHEEWHAPEAPQPASPPLAPGNAQGAALPVTLAPHFVASPGYAPIPPGPKPSGPIYTNTTPTSSPTPVAHTVITYTPPLPQPHIPQVTPANQTTCSTGNSSCTGCLLAAKLPITTWFNPAGLFERWTSTVVTETIVTEYITYLNNGTIDTVVTQEHTVNQTKTVTGSNDEIITHTTPTFTVEVTDGVRLQFDAGPTYVIYNHIFGGPDQSFRLGFAQSNETLTTCVPKQASLKDWEPPRTALQDWAYFVVTHTEPLQTSTTSQSDFPLPTQVLQYLEQEPAVQSQFPGLDLASCSFTTPSISNSLQLSLGLPVAPPFPPPAAQPPPTSQPVLASPTTSTFLSTTYESTSVYITVRGCLRCLSDSPVSLKADLPSPTPAGKPDIHDFVLPPNELNQPSDNIPRPLNMPRPTSNMPGPIASPAGQVPGQSGRPDHQDQGFPDWLLPVIVVGGQTLRPGQTQTVDGVPIIIPGNGEGARIVVGGSTVALDAAATPAPPVLTVGGGTIAANPQGEFVFGTETLKPGGPPVIVNGNTVSLGPGGVAVVNGVTQTITAGPPPSITVPPASVVGDHTIFTTIVGGVTVGVVEPGQAVGAGSWVMVDGQAAYVPAPGQTLTPGGVLTLAGITYSLPQGAPAGVVVINGQIAYVPAPGQTLTPGGALTISGTTYSMPEGAPAGVVVINGVTSTVTPGAVITPAPALTINDITYTQTVRDGTTEYVLGNGTTLVPGSTVEMDGTTYSLDKSGTALIINGQTSTVNSLPKSNSATTTSSSMASVTTSRGAGDLIASGVGQTSKGVGTSVQHAGIDRWVESLIVGAAGWLLVLF